jgi:hypothetical protein
VVVVVVFRASGLVSHGGGFGQVLHLLFFFILFSSHLFPSSALWYFLQLHVLNIGCNNVLAFFGTVFEPVSVLCVTGISVSMIVLVRGSLTLQTRQVRTKKNKLLVLLKLSNRG